MADHVEPHALQPLLDLLEERFGPKDDATRTLRDYIIYDSRLSDPGSEPASMLLVTTLTECVKPALKGDMEKQAIIDRIIKAVKQGQAETNITTILDELEGVAQSFKKSVGQQVFLQVLGNSLPRLLASVKALGGGVSWLEQDADKLIAKFQPPPGPDYPKELTEFCDRVIQTGQSIRDSWQKERQLFIDLLMELAQHLQDMRQNTGGMGRRLGEAVSRLKESQNLTDLQQLRIVLLREAEDLRDQTERLQHQLAENEARLKESGDRLNKVNDELKQTKAISLADPLTGVPNRRAFDLQLASEISRSTRYGLPLSLVILDLDHFKRVNDTYGHPVGDKVLVTVSDKVTKSLRKSDFLARIGGEEFVILLPETDLVAALTTAEKLRADIARLRFKTQNTHLTATASMGVCEWKTAMTAEQLLKFADEALYRAKQGGRNRVEAHAPPGSAP